MTLTQAHPQTKTGLAALRLRVADPDGTLLRSDMLPESLRHGLSRDLRGLGQALVALTRSRPALKACLAGQAGLVPVTLRNDPRRIGRLGAWRDANGDTAERTGQMAVVLGCLAVLVLAHYLPGPMAQEKFGMSSMLWAVCPLVMVWIGRMRLVGSRGKLHDDPLVWALENRAGRKVMAVIL